MNNRNFEISLSRMSDAQSTYQKAYIVLANYMTGIRKTTLNTSYLPVDKQSDAKQCYDAIQEVVSDYARTIGSDLKNVPSDMLNQMSKIINRLPNAIEAASRLNRGEGSQEDYAVVYKVLHDSMIDEYGKEIDICNAAIFQFDLMSQNFSDMVNSLDEVKTALNTIKDAWAALENDMNELLNEVEQAENDYDSEVWNSVISELNAITSIFNDKIKVKVEAMDISNIVVSDATYDFTLSNEEVQKMYDQSEKIDFIRYLRTA